MGGGDSGSGIETDITGYDRYAKVTESTDVTIYPYFDNDTNQQGYSYTIPSDPDAQIHAFAAWGMVIGDGWTVSIYTTGSAPNTFAFWGLSWEENFYRIYELHITGNSTVATGIIPIENTQVTLDLPASIYYPSPDGQFVNPGKVDMDTYQSTYLPFYANSNSEVVCGITCEDSEKMYWNMYAVGTISDNTAWLEESLEEVPYTDSVAFTIEDGIVTGATVTVDGNTYDVSLPSEWEEDEEETVPAVYGSIFLLPVSVYEGGGSGGGSGLSPTLTTVLSVIPLVLTVGLVLGAVTYLRMKN